MFGGAPAYQNPFDETWEWDGNLWSRQVPIHRPPARESAGMFYDPVFAKTIMFGGRAPGTLLDTWEWDGADWLQRAPGIIPGFSKQGSHKALDDIQESIRELAYYREHFFAPEYARL